MMTGVIIKISSTLNPYDKKLYLRIRIKYCMGIDSVEKQSIQE